MGAIYNAGIRREEEREWERIEKEWEGGQEKVKQTIT